MKRLKILGMTASLLFVQAAAAQNPVISTRYSNEEIAQAIKTYKASHSRDAIPPANLQQKFQADFPKARDVEWEAAGDIYEVEFEVKLVVKFRDFKAFYSSAGDLLMIAEEIYRSELPAVAKNAAESKYPKYSFEDIDKIQRGTEVFYKIEMERGETEVKLLVKSDGAIIEEKIDY
ncbi:MAG: PepSY-like domain-containing protein [Prevotellaceae bacterium]|jgi:hypothetical protein|nr:PepSY-like domain-containing protein [Prevotellaceae bacterium]